MKTIIIMAQTLDGIIARNVEHVADWTSKEDKKFFVESTKKGGVIVMGRNTFKTVNDKPLPGRLNLIMTMDEKDKEMEKAGLLEFAVAEKPQNIIAQLKKRGFKKVFIGGGSMINSLFFDNQLVDELWITIQPKVFGSGLKVFTDQLRDVNLQLRSVKKANQTVILKYGVEYGYSDTK